MRIWMALAVLLAAAAQVSAQEANRIARFDRTLEQVRERYFEKTTGLTLTETSRVLYGAYTTLSLLAVDNEARHTQVLRQVDSKLWVQAQSEGHMFYGRLRLRYQDFGDGDSFTGGKDQDMVAPIGDRYWYRFDWRTDQRTEEGVEPDWNWWVQIGRQYVHWVSGLALSETLYATRFGLELGLWRFGGFIGMTPINGTIDFDASRPNYTSDTDRFFWGVSVEWLGLANHRPFFYFVRQEDDNDQPLPGGAVYGYDSWYASVGSAGQIHTGEWLYRIELIFEGGRSVSDLLGVFPQTIDDVRAWAGRFLISYIPWSTRATTRLRFELELLLGSGDEDRGHPSQTVGGNLAGTNDESFNGFGYYNTGLALAPELSNIVSIRLAASGFPAPSGKLRRMRLQLDTFFFVKMDGDSAISVTTTPGDSFVGVEVDITLDWKLTSDSSVDLRYGIFVPGDAVPDNDPMNFFYLGFSYGF